MSFSWSAKAVRSQKQTALVFDDYDRSLEFTKQYSDASEPINASLFLVRDIYLEKARAAAGFEDYRAGIQFLSDGLKTIRERNSQDSENSCSLHINRGDLYTKLNDFDAALWDYTYPIDNNYVNCFEIYEKRGDAFAAKGEWQRAAKDYSQELTKFSYPHVRVLTKRARAYIRSGEAEKAISDLNEAMTFHKSCSEQYILRAEAFRLLKEDKLAAQDDTAAARLSRNKNGCSM